MLVSVILIISTSPGLGSRSKGVSLKHTDYDKPEQVQSSASSGLYQWYYPPQQTEPWNIGEASEGFTEGMLHERTCPALPPYNFRAQGYTYVELNPTVH